MRVFALSMSRSSSARSCPAGRRARASLLVSDAAMAAPVAQPEGLLQLTLGYRFGVRAHLVDFGLVTPLARTP